MLRVLALLMFIFIINSCVNIDRKEVEVIVDDKYIRESTGVFGQDHRDAHYLTTREGVEVFVSRWEYKNTDVGDTIIIVYSTRGGLNYIPRHKY